jgi:redox-sensitive bicupin YhaK (pirin superfamily)
VRLEAQRHAILSVPEGHTAAIAVLRGAIVANGSRQAKDAELVVFERSGTEIEIEAAADSTLLFLSGAPIPEPIVGYGPFVMNSRQEIETAMSDFRLGRFGRMPELQGNLASGAGS